jgi:hypothetical protein
MSLLVRSSSPIRRYILLCFVAGMIAALAACGNNNLNIQNPPAPAASNVSISLQPAPAATIPLGATTTLTAVVSNDSSNAGVDWSLLCTVNATCGVLAPLHTASGAAASYSPPATISGNSQTFTIEAFASADHTKNVVAAIDVTGFGSTLKGTYVFETKGIDANGPYALAGVIRLDGNGNITSGEQTHTDVVLSVSDAITGGSYSVGPDGRGTITINTADQAIGQLGVENLSLVYLSNSQAFIATLDNPNLAPSFEVSSGTLDLQTTTAAPSGGYAFAVNGTDIGAQTSVGGMAIGGIFKIDSPNTISGAGSVADQDDFGTVVPNATLSGTLTNPDAFGSFKLNLTVGFTATPIQFTGYILDAQHMKLIESDITGPGTGFGNTAGVATGQGAATGTFTSNSAFAGSYVYGILGQDLTALPSSLAAVGEFTADASGNLNTGYSDETLDGLGVVISDSFTGTYTLDPSGTGRVDSSINFSVNGPGPELIFYLTGNGNPPLVLDADASSGALGTGMANPQAAAPLTFNGKYGLNLVQSSSSLENRGTAQITANGPGGSFTGVMDINLAFSAQPDTGLAGNFGAIGSNGRSAGGLMNTFFPTPGTTPSTLAVAYYVVDATHVYVIETDSLIAGELSFGYFAGRNPVCSSCQ